MISEKLKQRLYKYKYIKERVNEMVEWENENQDELIDMWIAYCRDIKPIKYHVFFEAVSKSKLAHVKKSSYKHLINKK